MLTPWLPATAENSSGELLKDNKLTRNATDFRVLSKENRLVRWDGLGEVRIASDLVLTTTPFSGRTGLVTVDFNEEVRPGEKFAFSLVLTFRKRVTALSFFRRELRLAYFMGPQLPPEQLVGFTPGNEIRCLTYYTGDPRGARVAGGFDVKICHRRNLKATPSPSAISGITAFDANVNDLSTPYTSQMWRLRHLTDDHEVGWRTHHFDLTLDMEIPSTWPMFALSVLTSVVLAIFLAPYVKLWLWGSP